MSEYRRGRYNESGKQWEHEKVVRRQINKHKRRVKLKLKKKRIFKCR